jgi:nucleolar protein 14
MRGEEVEDTQQKKAKKKVISADDLDDDFVPDGEDQSALAYNLDENYENGEEAYGNEQDNQDDDAIPEYDETYQVVDNDFDDDEDNDEQNGEPVPHTEEVDDDVPSVASVSDGNASKEDIPFTFEAPSSYSQFAQWVTNRSWKDRALIIHRIRTCNHVSLKPENKAKMQTFYSILVEHIFHITKTTPFNIREVDILCKPLFELSQQLPDNAGTVMTERLEKMHSILTQRLQPGNIQTFF